MCWNNWVHKQWKLFKIKIKCIYSYYNLYENELYCINYKLIEKYDVENWNNLSKLI